MRFALDVRAQQYAWVVALEHEGAAAAVEAGRRNSAVLGRFVGEHDDGVTDLDLGMAKASAFHWDAVALGGAEGLFVERDGVRCAGAGDIDGDRGHQEGTCGRYEPKLQPWPSMSRQENVDAQESVH